MVAAIVAVDLNWGIGYNGDLLVNIPEDKKFFKETTKNATVIMGRKTWDSLPIKPLPNRKNIIISRNNNLDCNGGTIVTLDEAVQLIKNVKPDERLFVIGGGQIYKELLSYCDIAYVTMIYERYDSDTFFPNLNELPEWERVCTSNSNGVPNKNGVIPYNFLEYRRKTC